VGADAAGSEGESHGRKADGLHRLGPAARRLLAESGLSESSLKGTGPLGIVTKGDVIAAIARGGEPSEKVSLGSGV
jgi:pyruvate/2-oxoglutarate dehydrogenase complex dihydrolipoamide acyltransferase (E2) component